jgi:hypothetical protein
MFKKLSLGLASGLIAFASYGQTIVPTTPQNKNVVLEEFTGIYCVYCPQGHAIAQSIKDANPERVTLINIHTGGFAAPSGSDPDYRTPYGTAIAAQSGLTGYPAGQVNRHVFPNRGMTNGGTAMGRGAWEVSATEILAMPSYVNVGVEAFLDIQTRELIVHVEAYYTGDSPESTNMLNVALLQNNTKGPQTGGGAGNNYNHMHRLVDMLTGQWGEELTTTTEGTFVDRTYTFTIPEDYNNIATVMEDMEVAAFITETQQEIPTGSSTQPYFTGVTIADDASIESVTPIGPTCSENIAPVVTIKNNGQNTITALEISYEINGDPHTYNWTGSIPALWEEDIQLPETAFTAQTTNTVTFSIPNDEDTTNNTFDLTFDQAPEGTGTIYVDIVTDNWGYELDWNLKDSNGNVVESGTGYGNNATINLRFDIAADCYTFTATDDFGDGGNRVTVTDTDGNQLFRVIGNWGSEKSSEFASDGVLSVDQSVLDGINIYPNPTKETLNISNAETANIEVYDMLGRMILSKNNISLNEQLNISGLNAGAYFIKIAKEGNSTTKKFIVTN